MTDNAMAPTSTNPADAFIRCMKKIAANNQTDDSPSWRVKRFFHPHPAFAQRIALVKRRKGRS